MQRFVVVFQGPRVVRLGLVRIANVIVGDGKIGMIRPGGRQVVGDPPETTGEESRYLPGL